MLRIWGDQPLRGQIMVGGAKNSMQFVVTAALLTDETISLSRVPLIQDIYTLQQIFETLNCTISLDEEQEMMGICAAQVNSGALPFHLAGKLRSCLLFIPGLLTRFGRVSIPFPGGDRIGPRPLDTHFYIIRTLGGNVTKTDKGYIIQSNSLKPQTLHLPYPSFTGTGLAMMLAAKIPGITIINNAALEPELADLANLLDQMGAPVTGIGTRQITIHGTSSLSGGKLAIMPDRLEIGTFLIASVATKGQITFKKEEMKQVASLQSILEAAGCQFIEREDEITVISTEKLIAQNIETGPHPALSTDLQPQFMALMTQAAGPSRIFEKMHTKRFLQVPHLRRLGANIEINGQIAVISGPTKLKGTNVKAEDIRGGSALLIAALAAQGETRITGRYHLERGYGRLYDKLSDLGAKLSVDSEHETNGN